MVRPLLPLVFICPSHYVFKCSKSCRCNSVFSLEDETLHLAGECYGVVRIREIKGIAGSI